MTTEQAKQEAEKRVEVFFEILGGYNKIQDDLEWDKSIQCELVSINREIKLCKAFLTPENYSDITNKLQDLNKIKEQLLKM